jgi:hypothetical protein
VTRGFALIDLNGRARSRALPTRPEADTDKAGSRIDRINTGIGEHFTKGDVLVVSTAAFNNLGCAYPRCRSMKIASRSCHVPPAL